MTRFAGAALALALLAGACGSSPATLAPTGTAPAVSSPVPSAGPSAGPSQIVPQPSGGGWDVTTGTQPPTSHADPALEAKLPDSIRAVALAKSSFSGSSMPAEQTDKTKPTFDLLGRLGKQPADLTWASAADPRRSISTEEAQALRVLLVAYQVKGVSGVDLETPFLAVASEQYANNGFEKGTASVGGQTLQTFVLKSVPQAWTSYLVPRGDTLFIIQTPDPTLAAEALGSLQ